MSRWEMSTSGMGTSGMGTLVMIYKKYSPRCGTICSTIRRCRTNRVSIVIKSKFVNFSCVKIPLRTVECVAPCKEVIA